MEETEKIYMKNFAVGERRKAISHLRAPRERHIHHTAAWRSGLYVGFALPALIGAIYSAFSNGNLNLGSSFPFYLQLYATLLITIVFALAIGLNLIVWKHYLINYKSIFEFNPGDSLDFRQYTEFAALFLLLISLCAYFNFAGTFGQSVPPYLWLTIFLVSSGVIMICPFRLFYYSARRWLLIALGRVALSGFVNVEFRDFFIADELNSLSYSFQGFRYLICDSVNNIQSLPCTDDQQAFGNLVGVIFGGLPAFWRFAQCLRRYLDSGKESYHLVNAGKYTSSMAVVILTELHCYGDPSNHGLFVAFALINSLYTCVWDIWVDWGLFQPKAKYFLLRNELLYPRPVYYLAVFANIFLRFSWIFRVTSNASSADYRVVAFVIACGEVYRRFQWNFFRMENEHFKNIKDAGSFAEYPNSIFADQPKRMDNPSYQVGVTGGQTLAKHVVRSPRHEESGPSRASMYIPRDFDVRRSSGQSSRLEPLRNVTVTDAFWNELGVEEFSDNNEIGEERW